jgi:hypothetical protein
MNSLPTIPLFPSGRLVATPGALALLEQTNKSPLESASHGPSCSKSLALARLRRRRNRFRSTHA